MQTKLVRFLWLTGDVANNKKLMAMDRRLIANDKNAIVMD